MSPEQARGRTADKRADVWAFGVVLYEMLTGRQAFGGETTSDVLAKVIEREPDWAALPASTPPRLRELLRRCGRKDPKTRLQAIGDARIQIEELISGATEETATAGKGRTAYGSWRVHVVWASVLLAAVVTAIWLSARTASEKLPAPNAVPVIVLMDSARARLRSAHACRRRHERGRRDGRAAGLAGRHPQGKHERRVASRGAGRGTEPRLDRRPSVLSPRCTSRRRPGGHIGTPGRSCREPVPRLSRVCGGAQSAHPIHRVFTFRFPNAWRRRTVGRNAGRSAAGAERSLERLHRARRSGEGDVS